MNTRERTKNHIYDIIMKASILLFIIMIFAAFTVYAEIIPSFQIDDIEPLREFKYESFFTGIMNAPYCELIVNGKSGLVDYEGNVILEPLYDDIYYAEGAIHYYDADLEEDRVYSYIDLPKATTFYGYDDYSVWYWNQSRQELGMMDVVGEEYSEDEWDGRKSGCVIIREISNGNYEYENLFEGGDLGGYGLASRERILVEPKYENGVEYTYDGGGFFAFDDGAKWDIYGVKGDYGFSVAHKSITTSIGVRTIYPYGITEQTLAINTDNGAAIWDLNSSDPIQLIYEEARPVYDGKAWVKKNGQWRVIQVATSEAESENEQDEGILCDDIQPAMGSSDDGYFVSLPYNCIYIDGKAGLIDYDGNIVLDPEYIEIEYDGEGQFQPIGEDRDWLDVTDHYWYDDEAFEFIEYNYVHETTFMWNKSKGSLVSNYGPVDDEWGDIGPVIIREKLGDGYGAGGYGLATRSELILEPIFKDAVGYQSSWDHRWIFAFFDGSYWEYYDEKGEKILDTLCNGAYRLYYYDEYDLNPEPYYCTEGILAVNTDGGAGFYNTDGRSITGLIYDAVRPVYQGMAWVKQNGRWRVVEVESQKTIGGDKESGDKESPSSETESGLQAQRTVKKYAGAAKVDFVRFDASYNDGEHAINAYFDRPVFTGKKSASENINRIFDEELESFNEGVQWEIDQYIVKDEWVRATLQNPYNDYIDVQQQVYLHNTGEEIDAGVMYDDGEIISIMAGGYWCMGGVSDYPMYAHTFDVDTGEEQSIIDLFPGWLDFTLEMVIRDEVWTELGLYQANSYDAARYAEHFYDFHLGDMAYFVNGDGRLCICVQSYQLGEGAMGSPIVATNLYIGMDPADYSGGGYRVPFESEIESTKGNIHLTEGAKSINLRSGPGLDYDSVCTIHRGETMDYLNATSTDERGVEWYKCSYNGIVGWVSATYTILDN